MFVALLPLSAGLWLGDEEPWVFPWPGWVQNLATLDEGSGNI